MKKQRILGAVALLSFAIAVQSCSKVATNGSLDGAWGATDGTLSITSSQSESSFTYSYTQSLTFDGTNMKGTEVSNYGGQSNTENVNYPFSFDLSFDKKAGTYTREVVSESNSDNQESIYNSDGSYDGEAMVTSVDVTTESESGSFQLAGGNAEVEKGSILLLQRSNYSNTTVKTYTYTKADGTAYNTTGKKVYRSGGLIAVPASETITSTSTGNGDYDETITIVEVSKDVLTISMERTESSTEGTYTATYTSKAEFNLSAK